jgi:hypothetical protein
MLGYRAASTSRAEQAAFLIVRFPAELAEAFRFQPAGSGVVEVRRPGVSAECRLRMLWQESWRTRQ